MRGYDENSAWVDEPITRAQKTILTALAFPVPDKWSPDSWSCGAFAQDGVLNTVRFAPYLPEVNEVLRSAGFRWDAGHREWYGEDRTKAQVEVLQALNYCAGRYYIGKAPQWAVKCGTGAICPVQTGTVRSLSRC